MVDSDACQTVLKTDLPPRGINTTSYNQY